MLTISMLLWLALAGPGTAREQTRITELAFLLGDWAGEGTGTPGQGGGEFSFRWDLEEKVLVRTASADYPATKDRTAVSHRDLMVVYEDPAGRGLRASYFDNEGHVIEYAVTASQESGVVQFVGGLYRLTYTRTGAATVSIRFEIAPPGRPTSFSTYLEGTARRK